MLAHTEGEVVDLLRGGQGVLNIVPLSGLLKELDTDIIRFSRGGAQNAESTPDQAAAQGA